jgi:hypothetical protein
MPRIFISLNVPERDALIKLAEQEFRDPRAQAAMIIRQELERRGFLEPFKRAEQSGSHTTEAVVRRRR